MIEAVIVDDEMKALQSLSWELTNFSDEIKVMASFTDPFEALEYLEKNTPDCLFFGYWNADNGWFSIYTEIEKQRFSGGDYHCL